MWRALGKHLLTYLREKLADTDPSLCKTPIFNVFSLVAPGKKVQLTVIGNPQRSYQCTGARHLAVTKRPCECDCSYTIFARSASAQQLTKKVQLTLLEVHYALFNEPKMKSIR